MVCIWSDWEPTGSALKTICPAPHYGGGHNYTQEYKIHHVKIKQQSILNTLLIFENTLSLSQIKRETITLRHYHIQGR